jgi:hypothetical protein
MHFRPQLPITKLPIDLARLETAKGHWLVAVDSVAETIAGNTLLVGIILEQHIDDESATNRRLELMIYRNTAEEPENGKELLDQICKWIETTDEDGFLDLTKSPIEPT